MLAPAFDFTDLSVDQQALLTFQGWMPGSGMPQPHPRTVAKLVDRGLVTPYMIMQGGLATRAYSVPIAVHIAWCAWCAEHARDDNAE
jgi:hypothetical protein